MHILITNDDGYNAKGLEVLASVIKELNWSATIVAPKYHMSGASRSRISGKTLEWEKVKEIHGFPTYHVNGTPATCVVFALKSGIFEKFDYCLSGINAGENLGAGLTISGTFGAALEAASLGVKGIALSRKCENMAVKPERWDWSHLNQCVKNVLKDVIMLSKEWQVLNINFPNEVDEEITYLETKVSKVSYFYDIYNEEKQIILSGVGYNKEELEKDDDVFVLSELNKISVTFLQGTLI